MSDFTGEIHPLADLFPMLTDDDLDALAESIASDGLLSPIVLDAEGRLLDGRNRLAGCERAGVEPRFTTYGGDDPAGFVIASNVARRHMTTGQRAMSTAMVLAADGKRVDGRWAYGAKQSHDSVQSSRTFTNALALAGTVLDYSPSVAPDVAAGLVALDAAYKQACAIRDNVDKDAHKVANIERFAPDLLVLVREERMTLDEAHTVAHQRENERARTVRYAAEKSNDVASDLMDAVNAITAGWASLRADDPKPIVTSERMKQIDLAVSTLKKCIKENQNA